MVNNAKKTPPLGHRGLLAQPLENVQGGNEVAVRLKIFEMPTETGSRKRGNGEPSVILINYIV